MINSIRLQNFRSYRDESFEFDPKVNIIVGPNASGKTNLLEAVMVLAQGNSFRVKDIELISFQRPWARLDGYFGSHQRTLKLEANGDQSSKTYILDDKPFKRLSPERLVPIVFFEPNHLQLMIRGPQTRRDYIDSLIISINPAYKKVINDYRRALAQRNFLLKKKTGEINQQLFAWNVRLSELGSQIAAARQDLVDQINTQISKKYSHIARAKSKLALEYVSQFPADHYASRLLSKLEKNTSTDIDRGFTGHGPHREDFVFYLNKRPAASSASRGETRSILLALKAIELEMIEATSGASPIFLLDDVFSELDGQRRQTLVEILGDHQAIITTTDADAAVEYFADNHRLIPLNK